MLTPEQRAAGWREHDGGPCPVTSTLELDYLLRSGEQFRQRADKLIWEYGTFINEINGPMPRLCEIVAYLPEDTSHDQ